MPEALQQQPVAVIIPESKDAGRYFRKADLSVVLFFKCLYHYQPIMRPTIGCRFPLKAWVQVIVRQAAPMRFEDSTHFLRVVNCLDVCEKTFFTKFFFTVVKINFVKKICVARNLAVFYVVAKVLSGTKSGSLFM